MQETGLAVRSPGAERRAVVRVEALSKAFTRADGTVARAIDGASLELHEGESLVLLGPSGCGKTTLLRSIAGLEQPDTGRIEIRGETVFSSAEAIDVPPERRRLAMIFQSYALWPHMTAFQNVAYPLQSARVKRREIAERVDRVFELVGIPELRRQYPGQMSGGQQQRVALARALVGGGDLVLFDEPLSNVDAKVREQLRFELLSMQRELGFAALYVTHDQAEAMELAHRIAVMSSGTIEQLGAPREIYTEPRSRYVANFVGATNELTGTLARLDGDVAVVETALGEVRGMAGVDGLRAGDAAVALCRPERTRLARDEPGEPNRWRAEVRASAFLGPNLEHVVRVGEQDFRLWSVDTRQLDPGAAAWLVMPVEHVRVLPA
ncbi:MAG TPA: ABC transporter ATP-binding protein [Gaiellaceae bacterium]